MVALLYQCFLWFAVRDQKRLALPSYLHAKLNLKVKTNSRLTHQCKFAPGARSKYFQAPLSYMAVLAVNVSVPASQELVWLPPLCPLVLPLVFVVITQISYAQNSSHRDRRL